MHTASASTARKLKWLPREQWQRPYAEQESKSDLSGRAPLTGMFSGERAALHLSFTAELVHRDYARHRGCLAEFATYTTWSDPAYDCSCDTNYHRNVLMHHAHYAICDHQVHHVTGFWPGPCLLPSIAGGMPAAEVAVPRAPSTSPLSREMAGHLALLDAPALSPLASLASAGSDVSEASGERRLPPVVTTDLDASAQPHNSSTSRQARPPLMTWKHASSSMQRAGVLADKEGRPDGDQPKKRALEQSLAESERKRQRREQDVMDVSHDRCTQVGGPRLNL